MQVRREIEVDKDYEFTIKLYENGIQIVPSSASIVVTDNTGSEILSDNCSIGASSGNITFTLSSANNTKQARNFKNSLTYIIDGETKYYYELFDVVAIPILNLCTDEVLFDKLGDMRKDITERVFKTTETGGVNELRSLQLTEDTRNYQGGKLKIYFDQGFDHLARVVDYEKSSGSVIFEPAYTSAIPSDTTFKIRPSFQRQIDDTFERIVKRDIRNKIGIASRIIDGNLVTNMTAYKTLEMYSLSEIEQEGDKWDIRRLSFMQLYKDEFSALHEAVDANDDGNISDSEDENKTQFTSIEITR